MKLAGKPGALGQNGKLVRFQTQFVLALFAVGDVPQNHAVLRRALGLNPGDAGLGGKLLAIPAQANHIATLAHPARRVAAASK